MPLTPRDGLLEATHPPDRPPFALIGAIAGAMLAVGIGAVVALTGSPDPRTEQWRDRHDELEARTRILARAFGRYAEWRSAHPDRRCPTTVAELAGSAPFTDPWGSQLRFGCAASPFALFVWSAGEDRRFGTRDDLTSRF